jgi:hypothetical protein
MIFAWIDARNACPNRAYQFFTMKRFNASLNLVQRTISFKQNSPAFAGLFFALDTLAD